MKVIYHLRQMSYNFEKIQMAMSEHSPIFGRQSAQDLTSEFLKKIQMSMSETAQDLADKI